MSAGAPLQAAKSRRSSLDVEGSGSGGADLGTVAEGRQLSFINRLRLSIREEQSCQLQVHPFPPGAGHPVGCR
jgi:hypothetical protein